MQTSKRLLQNLAILITLTFIINAEGEGNPSAEITGSISIPTITSCPARTINYITHALPQSCLTSSWTSSNLKPNDRDPPSVNDDHASVTGRARFEQPPPPDSSLLDSHDGTSPDSLPTTFMSFEDWREMMLRRTGQDPQDLRSRKPNERSADQQSSPELGHTGLGEEDEIYLNFDTFLKEDDDAKLAPQSDDAATQKGDGDSSPGYRSKDAGKTCKERFSYSSFDAGATVLKSSPGAKNAKAILAENKDSYMLLECAAETKYVVVELSDDILVDTIVLANFEFFSSMIRHFRVSVSDRYPVKGDKWRELGVFEARNARDIQPFLVENPQIWAKYIRIDFLTHFGNEYYCPVSLLRVHGSRMLDTWKEETHQEEDGLGLIDEPQLEPSEDSAHTSTGSHMAQESVQNVNSSLLGAEPPTSSYPNAFLFTQATCDIHPWQHQENPLDLENNHLTDAVHDIRGTSMTTEGARKPSTATVTKSTDTPGSADLSRASTTFTPTITSQPLDGHINHTRDGANGTVASVADIGPESAGSGARTSTTLASVKSRNTGGGVTGTAAVQEGFFNAITKRLQQVETNLTLSLKYLEDQSRYMQEALQRGEQKQLSRVTHFLETLNQTVLADLRHLRDQYDQIWQSTVIALESHRDQSDRDILALGTRLNLLADEVVFQKRMAIVQAILLLSCLFLVIFSRGAPTSYFAPVSDQGTGAMAYRSPPSSSSMHPSEMFQAHMGIMQTAADSPQLREAARPTYSINADAGQGDFEETKILLGHEQATHVSESQDIAHFQLLSPSPTPSPPPETADSHAKLARHNQTNSMRQSSIRKPLPALPEHGESP